MDRGIAARGRRAWPLRHADLIVLFVAGVARVTWVLTRDDTLTWIDEQQFVDIARHLTAGHGYVSDSFRANPVLPVYLAVLFRFCGENYLYARLGQALLGAITCILVSRIARRVRGQRAGLVAGLLAAVYLPHIYLSGVFYVDTVLTFLSAVTVLLVMRADTGGRFADVLGAGVALGLTLLTRPLYLAYVPAACLLWLWHGHPRLRGTLARCALFVLSVAVTVLPWTLRNYRRYARVVPVSTGFGTKLWEGNNPLSQGDADDRDLRWTTPSWRERLAALPDAEQRAVTRQYEQVEREVHTRAVRGEDSYLASDPVLLPVALAYMREHPGRTVWLFGRKLVTLYSPFTKTLTENPDTSGRNKWLAALAFYPLLALAAVGTVMGLRMRARLGAVVLLVASISVTYSLLDTCTRFRLPLDPFLAVLAALPLVALWERISGRQECSC